MNQQNPHNHLSSEKSPYLLQHKNNPVNWYPWCPEAFARAIAENRLIFLSIGYSTCYWCHMMEKDSFEKNDVAEVLNKYYVAIKVDREEMPEIDAIYMEAVQGMTGQGGWPLSAFLTPDRKPFFGGTFFWRAQFLQILRRAHDEWINDPKGILEHGERIQKALNEMAGGPSPHPKTPDEKIFDGTVGALRSAFDGEHGGFGRAPKFPHGMDVDLLLYRHRKTSDGTLLEMAVKTLDAMARGGIYDHLGGGFHRYSTDERWFAPHFEKMLYDNALLAGTYLDMFCVTGKERFADVARETLDYVLREMTDAEGGFYTAEDAGDAGREGEFYVWTHDELKRILTVEELAHLEIFGVTESGNWEHGKNILHLVQNQPWERRDHPAVKSARQKLFTHRQKRKLPHRDDKILVSWNGLMINVLALGFRVLQDERYLRAARKAAVFLQDKMDSGSGLLRRFCDGEARFAANLDDYTFLIKGLIDLYRSDFDEKWISWAVDLQHRQNKFFWDEASGAYYFSVQDENLIVRQKTFYDGVIPSGNAVSLSNLMILDHLCFVDGFRVMAEKLATTLTAETGRMLMGCSRGLLSLGAMVDGMKEVVVVGDKNDPEFLKARDYANRSCLPGEFFVFGDGMGKADSDLPASLLQGKTRTDGKTTFYLCEGQRCRPPVHEFSEMVKQL